MIYVYFLALFFLASFFDLNGIKQTAIRKVTVVYLLVIGICFVGLRFHTGADWSGYLYYFDTVDWDTTTYGMGYKILNIFVKSIGCSYYVVQFIATLFFFISIYHLYKNYTSFFFLSFFLAIALCFGSLFMAQVRQSIAVSIILLGTKYLFNKKWKSFLLVIFFAMQFHVTAIFAIILIPLTIKTNKMFRIVCMLIGFIPILIPSLPIKLLVELTTFLPRTYSDIITIYLESQNFGVGSSLGSGLYFYLQQMLILLIVMFYEPKTQVDNFSINVLILTGIIHNCTLSFSMFGRIESYLTLYAILGWTKILETQIIRFNKNFFYATYLLLILFFFMPFIKDRTSSGVSSLTGRSQQYSYIPYYNVFFHPEDAQYRKDWNE